MSPTSAQNPTIILTTMNARYRHSAFGLRYLKANLAELEVITDILEFDINQQPLVIAESILNFHPRLVGMSITIWNVEISQAVVRLLKTIDPAIVIILGGPEVSHGPWDGLLPQWADYTVAGEGEVVFRDLCRDILAGQKPVGKILHAPLPNLNDLVLPYHLYNAEDVANRYIYVEVSRGCPFGCEFCLSALDTRVRTFPLAAFLTSMQSLLDQGARQFKFVDRTFNLKIDLAIAILDFFLERMVPGLFLHFEMVPDRLPEPLRQRLQAFPAGSIQLEVGVQTFNSEVQARINRQQENTRTQENLRWLLANSHAHLHTDLIFGLPGESLASMGDGFDQLVKIGPQEIQVGILKRLHGTTIGRHAQPFGMVYNPLPPYDILYSRDIAFADMQRLRRFARYWDLIGNSGRFPHFLAHLRTTVSPFATFLALSDWLYTTTARTHRIALNKLFEWVFRGMLAALNMDETMAKTIIEADFRSSGSKEKPFFF